MSKPTTASISSECKKKSGRGTTSTKWYISIGRQKELLTHRPLAKADALRCRANQTTTSCDNALSPTKQRLLKCSRKSHFISSTLQTHSSHPIPTRFETWASRVTARTCNLTPWTRPRMLLGAPLPNVTKNLTKF